MCNIRENRFQKRSLITATVFKTKFFSFKTAQFCWNNRRIYTTLPIQSMYSVINSANRLGDVSTDTGFGQFWRVYGPRWTYCIKIAKRFLVRSQTLKLLHKCTASKNNYAWRSRVYSTNVQGYLLSKSTTKHDRDAWEISEDNLPGTCITWIQDLHLFCHRE